MTDFFGSRDQAHAVAIQDDGRIVVAGRATNPTITRTPLPALARYRRDGRLDRGFAYNGRLLLRSWGAGRANELAIQGDGKILVAGYSLSSDWVLARLRQNGKLDRSFGENGSAHSPARPGLAYPKDIAIQPDGKIVVAGVGIDRDGHYLAIARYLRNGTPDPSFGVGGRVVTRFGIDTDVRGYGLAIQRDTKMVVSGESGGIWFVARFLADGLVDSEFGDGGVEYTRSLAGQAKDVAIQPNGKIVAAGRDSGAGGIRFALARYLPDGAPDQSFGEAGAVRTTFEPGRPSDYGNSLALQDDGRIVVAGTARSSYSTPNPARFALARYLPDGRLDRSFAGDGRKLTGFSPNQRSKHRDYGWDVATQANGRILASGYTDPNGGSDNFAIARYLGSAKR